MILFILDNARKNIRKFYVPGSMFKNADLRFKG